MRYPILAALLDEADRIRLAAATEAAGRDLLSESTPLPVFVIAENAARLPDLIHHMDAERLPREAIHLTDAQADDLIRRFDASNNLVDETPALPPAPDMARLFADPPSWGTNAGPMPPPAGKPGRRRTSSWRTETPEQRAEKRAKRKAAEKSRRRNRK